MDFPGDPVVKNPPANAGDTCTIPGPGRSHMPPSNYRVTECAPHRVTECAPQLLSAHSRAHALQYETPLHEEPVHHNEE